MAQQEALMLRAALESFQAFDVQGNGWLGRHQLKCALLALTGRHPSKVELDALLRNAHDGRVYFERFKAYALEVLLLEDPDEHIRQVFRAFDTRGAGFLSREDAQAAFRTGAPSVALPVVGEVFDALDLDHDGRVSCRDFVAMMRIKQVPAPLAPQLHRLQAT